MTPEESKRLERIECMVQAILKGLLIRGQFEIDECSKEEESKKRNIPGVGGPLDEPAIR